MSQSIAPSVRSDSKIGTRALNSRSRLAESFGPDAVPHARPRRARARFSPAAKKTLQLALREAIWLKAGAIGSEHILLGLLRCEDSDINALLAEVGVKSDELRKATLLTIGRAA